MRHALWTPLTPELLAVIKLQVFSRDEVNVWLDLSRQFGHALVVWYCCRWQRSKVADRRVPQRRNHSKIAEARHC